MHVRTLANKHTCVPRSLQTCIMEASTALFVCDDYRLQLHGHSSIIQLLSIVLRRRCGENLGRSHYGNRITAITESFGADFGVVLKYFKELV